MADVPTAEMSARRILGIYKAQTLAAGDALQTDSFVAAFSRPGWNADDLDAGLAFAVEEDWLEQVAAVAYRLTRTGAHEA